MRQRYWIKGLRALVREVAKDCPICRIQNARREPPEMGSLLQQRLSPFWKKWLREYLPTLTRRTTWFQPPLMPLAIGDLVTVVDENSKRNTWPRGQSVDVHQRAYGQVRSAVVPTVDGLVTRPSVKLAMMDILDGNTPRKQVNYEGGNILRPGVKSVF